MLKSIIYFVALIAALCIIGTESSAEMVVNILDDVGDSEKMVKILSFVALVATLFIISTSSYAATFTVTNLNDSGDGSLRAAIEQANMTAGQDEIVFDETLMGTITLSTGEMAITDDLTITGPGADVITINAQSNSRIFNIDNNDDMTKIVVSISGLKFINGHVTGSEFGGGGAIYNVEQLSIDSCVFEDNHADHYGGAIDNQGTITSINNSTFSVNSTTAEGGGGAIANFAYALTSKNNAIITSITNSTFSGNTTSGQGGAIFNAGIVGSNATGISNCTFSGNIALGTNNSGGAIANGAEPFGNDAVARITSITNSTFSGNSADTTGGAITNFLPGTISEITNSTFSANTANVDGGAIDNGDTISSITNSTFSGNTTSGHGGAITNYVNIQEITNSTFSGNTAKNGDGGAFYNENANFITSITNCTFSGNTANDKGGAIFNGGDANISFTTITNNEAGGKGGGLYVSAFPHIRNSIIAFNTSNVMGTANCTDGVDDKSNNYSDDSSCGFGTGNNASINLGPLQDNGGTTQTIALLGGDPLDGASPDCDPLDSSGTPTGMSIGVDQRYFPRPFGAACDAGAYEMGAQGPQGPQGPPQGPQGAAGSGGGCALAGANSTSGASALFVLLGYLLIPGVIVARRRFRRR